jgi:hypothetical protein
MNVAAASALTPELHHPLLDAQRHGSSGGCLLTHALDQPSLRLGQLRS